MVQAILATIKVGQRFLVASHEGPDGDAISSTLALTNALRELGKEVVAYNRDTIPEGFEFLPGADSLVHDLTGSKPFDAIFVLDAGELRRAGSHLRDLSPVLVNIDHHPHSEQFGSIHYVDEEASATGVLIYRILQAGQLPVSKAVAQCIYTAILSDTGSFRYSNANLEAFRVAGEMVELGVDPWEIAAGLYESQPEKRLRLLAPVLQTLTVSSCGRLASVSVTTEMMEQSGAGPEYTDGFVNYPRSIKGVEVGLFFRQVGPRSFKIGFRSKGVVDVGSLSRELGGGGHHNAAGAVMDGSMEEVRAAVFSRLAELLP